ncbi:MAG: DegT/DnrJ/EryC1/StrS aminotransferase family protein [Armatimonadetes bacterium]|nr:DegT/DnrJ/EryC1/StrS aminotransferase family protein [Armatimonadota bacterium]
MQISLFRPRIKEEAIAAAGDVLRSGWIGLGPKTLEFEGRFADYVGSPHCVGLNSCTAALHLALKVLNIPAGKEIITTPVTFVSTNHVILYEQLKPIFADIEPMTGNIDVESIKEKITPQTGAIIAMHYGGYPCDLDALYTLAAEHNIPVVEDCAHACGAEYKGHKIGGIGDVHAFSFHAVKNLPMGDGGALTVRSEHFDARLRRLRWLGIDKDTYLRSEGASGKTYQWDYQVAEVGFKYHMTDIEAAIGIVQLDCLENDNNRRRQIADMYSSRLADVPGLQLLEYQPDRLSARHLCCILAEDRDGLVDKLRENGVGVGVHYRRNDLYPMYEKGILPNAEWFSSRVMSLPLHLDLTDEEIVYICELIRGGW